MIITHAEIRDWRTHVRDQGATPDVLIIATKEKSINLAGVEYNLEGINTTKPIGKIDDLDVWVEKNSEVESICVETLNTSGCSQ